MQYLMLSDIELDINGGEYTKYVDNVFLGIESFNSVEEAEIRARELLKDLIDEDCSISFCNSVVKCSPLNDLGNITASQNIPI